MELEISFGGKQLTVQPIAASGLSLICTGQDAIGQMIVLDYQAADPAQYWKAWRALGGERQGLRWESGEPYRSAGGHRSKPWWQRLLYWLFPWIDHDWT